jgi:hypothetical protein
MSNSILRQKPQETRLIPTLEWSAVIEGTIPILAGLYATALGYGWVTTPSVRAKSFVPHFRWMGPFLVFFGVFLGWQDAELEKRARSHKLSVHPPAEQIATDISKRLALPAKVDEVTRIDAVDGSGDVITYRLTILTQIKSAESLNQMRTALEEQRNNKCNDPNIQKLLKAGYVVDMRYSFLGTSENALISFSPRSCKL